MSPKPSATRANSPTGRPLAAVVLAAGKGRRFPGVPSKVLVELQGRPLVLRVLATARALGPRRLVVVVGHGKEEVARTVAAADVEVVDQGEPRGTGHALLAAGSLLGRSPWDVLVLSGDVPLLRPATLERLVRALRAGGDRRGAALLSATVDDPGSYGRVVRDRRGAVAAVVEAADASPAERAIREINVGAYAFRCPETLDLLGAVRPENAQAEVYLTDAVSALVRSGLEVEAVRLDDPLEGHGVNTPDDLRALEKAAGLT